VHLTASKSRDELVDYVEQSLPEFWAQMYEFWCFADDVADRFGCQLSAYEVRLFESLKNPVEICQELGWDHPKFTDRQLAEWIVDRIPRHRFESVNIAGVDCLPAGIFWGMRDLLKRSHPDLEFAPSTPLMDRLTGADLDEFWNGLRTQTRSSLSTVDWPLAELGFALTAGGLFSSVFGIWLILHFQNPHYLILVFGSLGASLMGKLMADFVEIPDDIITFGDLARHLAKGASEAS